MVLGEAGHVEGAMLHADIHVIGPGGGVFPALGVGQHVAAVRSVVVDCLVLFQQLDGAVDPACHAVSLRFSCQQSALGGGMAEERVC